MTRSEHWFNILLSVSIFSWALLGLLIANDQKPFTVRICITSLHLTVSYLVFIRSGVNQNGTLFDCLLAMPALLVGAWAFAFSPAQWPPAAQLILFTGTTITTISFIFLGSNFAILPALRQIVRQGPYSYVRHPAYLGELLLIAGCCLAKPNWMGGLILILAIIFVIVRIKTEERVLGKSESYQAYTQQVVWRLIPRIW